MTRIFQPKPKWKNIGSPPGVQGATWFKWGDVNVFVENHGGKYGWHLSISTPYRNPTWEEIKAARYDLLPHDVTMAMVLPPTSEYVNIHQFCFHLHQIPNEEEMYA
jgi:hypothetical protein